ncbi:hypothetical protein NJC38_05690 [Pseudomonas sp. 21LCFQ010]|uniref:hypothetical protein n=1 Tax=Pseudomonas sp. 21LCFQ010 TaxID=2957506 RepID=UPI0020980DC7|nr:hypothetical protein [Pseudomonas sp. 21LCFQ010]MCO8161645.1 hypothetical protein [Pseudomonas sp. 21LCFQ010]
MHTSIKGTIVNDLIQNGYFIDQNFEHWFSTYYPQTPELPNYKGRLYSVLLKTGDHLQQNIPVRRDAPFTVTWEFTAKLIADSGNDGAAITTGFYAASDHPSHITMVRNTEWQTYSHEDVQPIVSNDGYLGITFSDLIPLPDQGKRTAVHITGFKLWATYLSA